ncbi:kinase-like domain-containing protein [Camillea tinctor]|nr:kinase-like domain-containing protein [Camillea tinctor]
MGQPQPIQRDPAERYAMHTERLKRDTAKFWYYRKKDTKMEGHDYSNFWVGRKIPWGDPEVNGPVPQVTTAPGVIRPNYYYGIDKLNRSDDEDDPTKVEAIRRRDEVRNFFMGSDPQYKFERTLGVGGNGIAVKYSTTGNPPPGVAQEIVVKYPLRSWQDKGIREEIRFMRKFRRSKHLLQLIDPVKLGKPPLPDDEDEAYSDDSSDDEMTDDDNPRPFPKKRKNRWDLTPEELARKRLRWDPPFPAPVRPLPRDPDQMDGDVNKDYMITEFAGFGSLTDFISLIARKNETIPNRIIWRLWLCLVRGIIGMAFPVRKFHPDRRAPGNELLDEIVPENDDLYEQMQNYVHFDLDPTNVFVDDNDMNDPEHDVSPLMKIADFGLTVNVKTMKRDTYYSKLRYRGKSGFFSPEQFSEGWDLIPDERNGDNICRQPVCGNFGPHTNVWAIGCILFSLVTGSYPPLPPQAADVNLGGRSFTSYGWYALDAKFAHVDPPLRFLVAQCMAHTPANRPSLRDLLDGAMCGVRYRQGAETADEILDWQRRVFCAPTSEPGAPPAPSSVPSLRRLQQRAQELAQQFGLAEPSDGGADGNDVAYAAGMPADPMSVDPLSFDAGNVQSVPVQLNSAPARASQLQAFDPAVVQPVMLQSHPAVPGAWPEYK